MFAVLFIPNFSLQAVLRHEPELLSGAVALVDPALPKPAIVQLTAAARAQGVCEGLTASQAMARCAELIIKSRSLARETVATEVLLQTAYAFSPNIEATAPGVCTMELKGLRIQFDGGEPTCSSVELWARKILELLAQGHNIVTTSIGKEGIDAYDGNELLVADSESEFVQKIEAYFNGKYNYSKLSLKAVELIEKKYCWETIGAQFEEEYLKLLT